MKFKYLFCFLLMIVTNVILSQNQKKADSIDTVIQSSKVDSVKAKNYLELSKLYRFDDPKQMLLYSKKALELYQITNHHKGQAEAYFYQTSYYNSIGKLDSARYFMKKNIDQLLLARDTINAATQTSNMAYFELADGNTDKAITMLDSLTPVFIKYNDSSSLARTYIVKSQAYSLKGYKSLTLEVIQKALSIYRNLNDKTNIAQSLLIIGDQYQSGEQDQKAITAFKEALELYKRLNNKIFVAQTQSYLGDSYLAIGNYNEADKNLNEALQLSKELNFNANIGRTYINLGRLHLARKEYDKAIDFLKDGLNLYQSLRIPHNETRARFNIGRAYFEKGMYSNAIENLDQSISISKRINDINRLKDALYYKSLALENLGETKDAFLAYKESKLLSDSIFNEKSQQKISELQIKYETEKKEQQIAMQNNEIELLEEKSKVSNLQRLLLGVGLVLSLTAIGLGWFGFKQKLKRNKSEKEKLDKELEFKKKELTTHALQLAKKNELLGVLKSKAEVLKTDRTKTNGYQELISTINLDLQDDKNWGNFTQYFEQAYKGFNQKIKEKYPQINTNDLRFIALLKMNLSNKEVASILNISPDGVKKARYRIRKKLNLSTEDSLEQMVQDL
ncbi:tetratricopeptide repeat protein [uncultured Psychroserpens sp.]|uniref:tetratricopeptide repeat protein n=1 Tax=uncultured Psychroserpens sp. TaxID=255436 RepID=UPI002606B7D4|nr:tetratricopeptide repeat protein [uncultured Psychroserpens sp.]